MPLGLLPGIILVSIPSSDQKANAKVSAMLFSLKTHELLGMANGKGEKKEIVNGWGYKPSEMLGPIIGDALQNALESLSSQSQEGYPEKRVIKNYADFILERGSLSALK